MSAENKTIKAGVIGWPIEHSLSPRLHCYWLREYGIDGVYDAHPVKPEDAAAFIRGLAGDGPGGGFAGINVTVPHKETAFSCVDEMDDFAKRVGAVNTIVVGADGKLIGSNTDGFGFMESLKSGVPGWEAAQGPVTVIGAGGAARAIVTALLDAGAPLLRLVNRTGDRAQSLAAEIGGPVEVVPWEKRTAALKEAALLVNTTTLGMAGAPPLDLDLGNLPDSCLVTDIVYAPLITPLLAAAAERGNVTVDGIGMLLHQARPGFRQWFGVEPTVTPAQRTFVLEAQ
ncbi:MAG: shikimate dehydrogenase [Proteobacteria bacterium]|nr:shikimate dehydrogenase [Pseudomonadota bacterium]MDA1021754.1 shikimate dehydrogenase [Pseudomonadota bacterium]